MNSFLEKLFSIPNFGTILLILIIVLAIIFIILFALALKDAKRAKQNKELLKEQDTEANMSEVAFAQNNIDPVNLEIKNEEIKQDNVTDVSSLQETKITNDVPFVNAPLEEPTVAPLEIEKEEQVVISQVDDKAKESEIDLRNIAMSLAKEYQEEIKKTNSDDDFFVKPFNQSNNEQFSKVNISNDDNKNVELPNINDLPTPQPVKVVGETKIMDSSEKREDTNINNLEQETYTLK